MSRFNKFLIVFLLMVLAPVAFMACGEDPTPPPIPTYALQFSTESAERGGVSATAGGTAIQSGASFQAGTAIVLVATENAGYTFDGWYNAGEKVSDDKTYNFSMPSNVLSLVARFNVNKYVLTYSSEDADKGAVNCEIASGSEVAYKTSVTLTATEEEGYSFDGWYEGSNKVSSNKAYSFTMPANALTLVAKFNVNKYVLTYSSEDTSKGTVTSEIASGTEVAYKTNVTLTASEENGYTFDGWYEGSEKKSNSKTYNFTMPTNAVTLIAKFNVNKYVLTYSSEDADKGTVTCEIESGSEVDYKTNVSLTASEEAGYTFAGWYQGSEKKSDSKTYNFAMPANAVTLVAKFNVNKYVLTYSSEDADKGTVTCEIASGSEVDYKTNVSLTASEEEGYTFDGWYEGSNKVSSNKAYSFTMPANALTLVAKFNVNKYVLTYSSEDADKGTVTCEIASGSEVDYKTNVSLTASEEAGYTFDGWYQGSEKKSDSKTYNFTMPTNSVTLVAKFNVNKYLLTYSSEDTNKGSVTCEIASGSEVEYKTNVSLTASEEEGYTFIGWYDADGKVSDSKTYNFTMPTNAVTLEARFIIQKRVVHFYDGTTLHYVREVNYNSPVSVEGLDLSKSGYNFVGWFTASNHKYEGEGIKNDLDLYAKFEASVVLYTVRFFDYDNTKLSSDQSIEMGYSPLIPANPSRTGYDFAGWEFDDELLTGTIVVESDMDIFATYTPKEYLVKFFDDDGKTEMSRQSVKYNETATKPQTPEKEGYIFVKWLLNGYEYDFETSVTDALDIYASWKEVEKATFTVTFLDDEGGNVIDTQKVEDGASASAPQEPTKTGKVFKEWSGDFSIITQNTTIYAIYETATFEVTFAYYSASEGKDVESKVTVNYGESATAPSDYEKTGYTFGGWDKALTNITQDTKITAIYTIKTFTASFMLGGDEYTTDTVNFGESYHIPATPQVAGYSFMGWYADDEFKTAFDFTVSANSNVRIYGKLELIVITTHTVEFVDDDLRLISRQTIVDGESASAPGNPTKEGYTFVSWNKSFENVTSDLVITAVYEINSYTITYLKADKTTLIDTKTCNYGSDASALVNAPEITGMYFIRWSKDLSSVSRDETVYAIYASNIVTVHFVDENGDEISSQEVEYGSKASVPSTPTKAGCLFRAWLDSNDNPFDFNTSIVEETTLHAQWENVSGLYSVYFKDYDGATYGNVQRILAGYTVEEPVPPTKAGVTFDGWYIEGTDEKFDFSTPILRTLTLVARAKAVD